MNREQAQEILSAYDPARAAEANGYFDDALRAAQEDPQLDEWLQLELERDAGLRDALTSVRPPRDLKASILAAHGVDATPPKNVVPFPTLILRVAAAIALLLALVFTIEPMMSGSQRAPSGQASLDGFRGAMAQRIQKGFGRLDYQGSRIAEVSAFIASTAPAAPETRAPAPYAESATHGCQILSFCDAKVTMVCYERESSVVHVFTIARSALEDGAMAP